MDFYIHPYRTSRCLSDGITPYGVMVEEVSIFQDVERHPKNMGTNAGTTLHADSMNVTSSFVA
jgi:hypothetical protein